MAAPCCSAGDIANTTRASLRGRHGTYVYNSPTMHESKLFLVQKEPGPQVPNNLPAQPSTLVGRRSEIETIRGLLARPDLRLLTLVGPGGVGKTRLALEIANALLEEFPDGVYLVELAPITDHALVIPTIATTLNVRESPGAPHFATLKEHLRDKQILLLLDNFEQILAAGAVVAEVLAACPRLKLLVTSRSPLRLRAEHEFPLSPLALPEPGHHLSVSKLSQYSAVTLFVQRAQAVKPDFELRDGNASAVVEVCRRVDGLPLAIELVAAHTRLLPPQSILARLTHPLRLLTHGPQDSPTRHQTMRDTIEWSYNILTEREQRLFRSLSVFVGGCALQAAEAVCNEAGNTNIEVDHPLAIEVLEGIEALIDRSLIRRLEQHEDADPRLLMLETVREYAWEQLVTSGEVETMRRRHADYFLLLGRQMQPVIQGSDIPVWMGRLGPEHDNLRAALRWLLESNRPADHEAALDLILGLQGLWGRFHNTSEVEQWLETALNKVGHQATLLRVRGLRYAATVSYLRADYSRAETWAMQALAGARELNDETLIAHTLSQIGLLAVFQEKYEEARTLLGEALEIYRRTDNQFGVGTVCINLGEAVRYQGNYAQAEAYYRESLRILVSLGRKGSALQALSNIGHVVYMQGDLPAARATFIEALDLAHELDARKTAAEVLTGMSSVMLAEAGAGPNNLAPGQHDLTGITRAVYILGITASIVERSGRQLEPVDQQEFDRNIASARAILGEQAFDTAWQEGLAMTIEQAIEIAGGTHDLAAQTDVEAQPQAEKSIPGGLTKRELDVAILVAQGLTNIAIARQMVLSKRTVEMHVTHALHKLDLTRRTELAAWAIHNGLAPGKAPH